MKLISDMVSSGDLQGSGHTVYIHTYYVGHTERNKRKKKGKRKSTDKSIST